jgi:CMP-N,N'-diacetyllegionaminic acid synthase
MSVVGIVTARGGSKGIPRKNLADLGGRPLLAWTAEVALASQLDRVVLSTEDDEIAALGLELGLEVPVRRPAELAADGSLSIDVVLHMLAALEDPSITAVMLLQPTAPFRLVEDIDGSMDVFATSGADSVISVVPVDGHHPARMKFIEDGRIVDPPYVEAYENQPRQELRPVYIKNGAIYLTRREVIEQRSFKGADCRAWVMPHERSVNIDGPFDLGIARVIAEGLFDGATGVVRRPDAGEGSR